MTDISKLPLVSVIVATKNNTDTLEECLESIARQTYQSVELIVVDNNSTDNTKEIAERYTKLVFNKGPERSAQRNFGVEQCAGSSVLIIDSDMKLSTNVVQECVNALSLDQQAIIIPEESFGLGFWAQCKQLERSFYNGVDWIEAPRFFTKNLYENVGGYDEDMVGGEDWDLHARVKQETAIGRIRAAIMHNEGKLSLTEIYHSRRYYTKGFASHFFNKDKPKVHSKSGATQAIGVYLLFLKQPKKLFRNPIRGLGLLFMKTIEFFAIAVSLIRQKVNLT